MWYASRPGNAVLLFAFLPAAMQPQLRARLAWKVLHARRDETILPAHNGPCVCRRQAWYRPQEHGAQKKELMMSTEQQEELVAEAATCI